MASTSLSEFSHSSKSSAIFIPEIPFVSIFSFFQAYSNSYFLSSVGLFLLTSPPTPPVTTSSISSFNISFPIIFFSFIQNFINNYYYYLTFFLYESIFLMAKKRPVSRSFFAQVLSCILEVFIKEIRYGERNSAFSCQRFSSLPGPSDWWFLMMLSISLRSLAGRSPGMVFLTLDVALP